MTGLDYIIYETQYIQYRRIKLNNVDFFNKQLDFKSNYNFFKLLPCPPPFKVILIIYDTANKIRTFLRSKFPTSILDLVRKGISAVENYY